MKRESHAKNAQSFFLRNTMKRESHAKNAQGINLFANVTMRRESHAKNTQTIFFFFAKHNDEEVIPFQEWTVN